MSDDEEAKLLRRSRMVGDGRFELPTSTLSV